MIDAEYITLEDGLDYIIVCEIKENDKSYLYMTLETDEKTFCIRKQIIENGKEYIIPLDDENEYNYALNLFSKKMNSEIS